MSGFRKPPVPREQLVLWSQRLDDALPVDHPARLMDELFNSRAFEPLFAAWVREYHLLEDILSRILTMAEESSSPSSLPTNALR